MSKLRYLTLAELREHLSALEAEVRTASPERLEAIAREVSEVRQTIGNRVIGTVDERTAAVNGEIPGAVVSSARSQEYSNQQKRSDGRMMYATDKEEIRASAEYRTAFYETMMGRAITPEKRELLTTVGAAAVIPTNTFGQVVENIQKVSGLLGHVRILDIPGRLTVPQSDINTPAAWVQEGAEIADSNLPPTSVTLGGHSLAKLFSMSVATQSMSVNAFESYLVEELTRCTRDALAEAILTGSGEGQPLGILNAFEWDASNSTVITDSAWSALGNAMAKLPANFRQGAVFTMNSLMFFGYLAGQEDSVGQPLFTKDRASGLPLSLMGKPIIIDDFCPDDTILFCNPRYYFLNFSAPMAIERSGEAGFTRAVVMYRSLAVVDGKPVAPSFIRITRTV